MTSIFFHNFGPLRRAKRRLLLSVFSVLVFSVAFNIPNFFGKSFWKHKHCEPNVAKLAWLNLTHPAFSHHLTLPGAQEQYLALAFVFLVCHICSKEYGCHAFLIQRTLTTVGSITLRLDWFGFDQTSKAVANSTQAKQLNPIKNKLEITHR